MPAGALVIRDNTGGRAVPRTLSEFARRMGEAVGASPVRLHAGDLHVNAIQSNGSGM